MPAGPYRVVIRDLLALRMAVVGAVAAEPSDRAKPHLCWVIGEAGRTPAELEAPVVVAAWRPKYVPHLARGPGAHRRRPFGSESASTGGDLHSQRLEALQAACVPVRGRNQAK